MTSLLSLTSLTDSPPPSLAEALAQASRVVSERTGIVAAVELRELAADDPAVYWAWSFPANVQALTGQEALNRGSATAIDRDRAILKAVGESIERYCVALYDERRLIRATATELGAAAVPPREFALFSERQYAQPGFPYGPIGPATPLRWVEGHSLVHDRPAFVPAAFVYVPYRYDTPHEPIVRDPISTGTACAATGAVALTRAILELVERDAYMIVWQNRLARPHIDLGAVRDATVQRILNAFDGVPVEIEAVLLTLDIGVCVIMVVVTSRSGSVPLTVIGMGTDLAPARALALALEEAALGYCGMRRLRMGEPGFMPEPDFGNVTDLSRHGLAHATWAPLAESMAFLRRPSRIVALDDLPDTSSPGAVANVREVVARIREVGLDVVAVDLTTPDVEEAGFRVVRAVVPGLQPLDVNHRYRHLGGHRLSGVPLRLGLVERAATEDELNPWPHPFP